MVYCKHRLLSPALTEHGYYFDRQGIRALRRIEALRPICGDDLAGIKIILDLTDALERLHSEVLWLSRTSAPASEKKKQRRTRSISSRKTKQRPTEGENKHEWN
jgi:hypothetical protein